MVSTPRAGFFIARYCPGGTNPKRVTPQAPTTLPVRVPPGPNGFGVCGVVALLLLLFEPPHDATAISATQTKTDRSESTIMQCLPEGLKVWRGCVYAGAASTGESGH